ncbi:MAG: hypothetical protein HY814_04625 [Candidatus Riflebacteria bacterium]|nr:hypothetical protein [Candidatus Riflebacteria bacterium]
MGASKLPPEVIRVIEARDGAWTDKADTARTLLGIDWPDVIQVARTAQTWKRTRDRQHQAIDGYVDAVEGRDRAGHLLYMAGKRVYYRGEVRWYVITIHDADE